MNNHTPGPWSVHTDSQLHGEYTIYAGESRENADAVIAEVAGGLGIYDDGCCESEANAALIAAAPDLLAALEAIVKITDGSQPIDYPGALMVARHALAKAKGESQ